LLKKNYILTLLDLIFFPLKKAKSKYIHRIHAVLYNFQDITSVNHSIVFSVISHQSIYSGQVPLCLADNQLWHKWHAYSYNKYVHLEWLQMISLHILLQEMVIFPTWWWMEPTSEILMVITIHMLINNHKQCK
jgi:hypothetical protein